MGKTRKKAAIKPQRSGILSRTKAAAKSPSPARALSPMEARTADALPQGEGWQYEPKWDGFRCIATREGTNADLVGKSGKSLARFFPEMVEALEAIPFARFALDGELVIGKDENLSFDALQMRLHPAESRIRKLARETPAQLLVFDMLRDADGVWLTEETLPVRRKALERFIARAKSKYLRLSPYTYDVAEAGEWLAGAGGARDGVVAKRTDEPYRMGERAMVKVKRRRTADCVVGGFRYGEGERLAGSLLLGLYNDKGLLDHVGFTSGFATLDRAKLTRELERLKGGAGFTGDAPGGPSRWSTERSAAWVPVKPKLVAEVRYDHITGGRFRHGTKFLRWRPDKNPRACTFEQL